MDKCIGNITQKYILSIRKWSFTFSIDHCSWFPVNWIVDHCAWCCGSVSSFGGGSSGLHHISVQTFCNLFITVMDGEMERGPFNTSLTKIEHRTVLALDFQGCATQCPTQLRHYVLGDPFSNILFYVAKIFYVLKIPLWTVSHTIK